MFSDKTMDLVLEEGASLAFSLKLESETEVCTPHPVTGEDTVCHIQRTTTDISTGTFAGNIVAKFGEVAIASFIMTKDGDGTSGVVTMVLQQGTVQAIANSVRDSAPINSNKRLRDVGFYSVTYSTSEGQTRIMEGRVTMSLGG